MSFDRSRVVEAAREWIGTPYHHQASVKGVGCDCLGLVRGVYRELCGDEPETVPAYTPDWAEGKLQETLLLGARRHLREREPEAAEPGDILVFRLRERSMAKHMAILATPQTMIHAMEHGPACEIHYGQWWQRHCAASFIFPGFE